MNSVVQSGNLIPVPPEMAQEFGLHEGSPVEWIRTEQGAWTLRPATTREDTIRSLRGAGKRHLAPGESGVGSFLKWREEERLLDDAE